MYQHFRNEKNKENVKTFMLPSCFKGVENVTTFGTVEEPAQIMIDSEKKLERGKT